MEIKCFPDTDTLAINFSEKEIVETRDINENLLIELDSDGNLVSMTITRSDLWVSRAASRVGLTCVGGI